MLSQEPGGAHLPGFFYFRQGNAWRLLLLLRLTDQRQIVRWYSFPAGGRFYDIVGCSISV
jgi:hypothetical protein